jgi:CheY-like chemotaxis protein
MWDVGVIVSTSSPDRDVVPTALAPTTALRATAAVVAAMACALVLGAEVRDVLAALGLGALGGVPLALRALRRADAARRAAEEGRCARLRADKLALLARVGHELRTPMNGVLAVAELLETTPLDTEQARWVGTIRASGAAVVHLLDDLTEYAELEGGGGAQPVERRRVSLPALLADVARRAAERSGGPAPELTLAPDVPRDLALDGPRLGRALVGLVDALQLLGGAAGVRGVVTRAGERLQVTLTHPAARMSPARRAQVFAPLVAGRLEPSLDVHAPSGPEPGPAPGARAAAPRATSHPHGGERRAGGAGLGLAITRARLARLEAEVTVDADASGAAEIRLTLPLVEALPGARPSRDASGPRGAMSGRVLVVDDNPVNRRVAEAILARLGLSTVSAANGDEAVRAAAEGGFALVLMDLEMPVLDGYAATRRIRAHETAAHVPIVAMTAAALESDAEECRRAGMDDVLTKPLTVAQVEETLARFVGAPTTTGGSVSARPRAPSGRGLRRAG